jgi:hypothetical protein
MAKYAFRARVEQAYDPGAVREDHGIVTHVNDSLRDGVHEYFILSTLDRYVSRREYC